MKIDVPDWSMHTPRAQEEIRLYQSYLPRLQQAWKDNGPGVFEEPLNEVIDDIEALARTTVVMEVETRLMALMFLMSECGDPDTPDIEMANHHKVNQMIIRQKLCQPLEWLPAMA